MSTGIQFDSETSRALDLQYTRPQMVVRRAAALRHASPKLDEDIIDIGCGPGYLTRDLAAGAGESGSVLGIDQSESMLEIARARCEGMPGVRFEQANAVELPAENESFDLVVSTQVMEYVEDIDRALSEIARVLRPGGRTLLLATDWRACAWHSSDEERMQRMLSAWEEHLAHPALPRTLAARLEKQGLVLTTLERHSIVERSDERTGYSAMLMSMLPGFAPGRRGVTEEEAQAWLADLEQIRDRGESHLSVGQYFFGASKPR
jgi:arsenite methyltransferase